MRAAHAVDGDACFRGSRRPDADAWGYAMRRRAKTRWLRSRSVSGANKHRERAAIIRAVHETRRGRLTDEPN
jgi:hypothetical protein